MTDAERAAPPRGAIARIASLLAFAGGVVLLGVAFLTTVSVLLRWLAGGPIKGDFELVSLGSGLAVLGFLAYGTIMRANILVDTFTGRLPRRANHLIDAFWTAVWGLCTLVLAERMAVGAAEALASRTTTIGLLGVPIWWAIAIGAACFAVTAAAAGYWALRFVRGRAP
jgi:TRAP-type C4-dicarboxylate transport system permease small subunit